MTPKQRSRAEQLGIAIRCATDEDGLRVLVNVPIRILPSIAIAMFNEDGSVKTMAETFQSTKYAGD